MKRTNTPESTTATRTAQMSRKARLPPGVALASSAAVTLPASALVLHGHSPALILAVGLLPALPLVLMTVAFVCVYTLASVVAVARCLRSNTLCSLDELFTLITNAPIAFLTLKPLDLPRREEKPPPAAVSTPTQTVERAATVAEAPEAKALEADPSGLPGKAELQATPHYYSAIVDSAMPRDTGDPPAPGGALKPSQGAGRHARRDVVEAKAS